MNGYLPFTFTSGLLISPFMLSGQAYFQQRVDHVIEVSLNDEEHLLNAFQQITYTNNGPVSLDTLWMHLWPNAYREKNTALDRQLVATGDLDLHFASEEERGWIDGLDFRVRHGNDAGEPQQTNWGLHEEHPDIAWIRLEKPLPPGTSLLITTPFQVKIPSSKFSRLGHTGQAYHITQWYPKPAVFDAEGWHAMPYLTQGEFYSEFGSFDVSIELPANYVVGATGILQNAPAELAWMDSLASLEPIQESGKVMMPAMERSLNAFPPSSEQTKTLRFVQENVHDFAWFADKRFVVRKGGVTLPKSGREITTWALFTPRNAANWESIAITSLNESVSLYSKWVGEYPYDACTAVDGTISAGGGMEYPMITIIGNMGSERSLDNVIAHEVGHNWFYGILGSNEREHPWMDEGINSFVELRYMRERYPSGELMMNAPIVRGWTKHIRDGHRFQAEAIHRINARRNLDQPITLSSTDFTSLNYAGVVYSKTALVMDHLFAYLGEEVFDRCMHSYYEEWKFKHPRPQDVRTIFERESGKDLSWFFVEAISTDHKIDLKARRLRGDRFQYKSTSTTQIPFPITAWKDTIRLGTVWLDGASGKGTATLPWQDANQVNIDEGLRTMDIDRRNNGVAARGILRRSSFPHLGFLTGIERYGRKSIYLIPLIARNSHDGYHLGIGLHNYHFPSQRTEWIIAPTYGLNSGNMVGAARLEYHFDRMRSKLFQSIGLALNVRNASTLITPALERQYRKIAPSIQFDLKRDPLARPWIHSIRLRGIHLRHDAELITSENNMFGYSREDIYGGILYTATNGSHLLPTMIRPTLVASENFLRASLEITQGFTYNARKDQLRLRLFAGNFLWLDDHYFLEKRERLDLSWGQEDMLYDHVYMERDDRGYFAGPPIDAVATRQFYKQQGAFRTPFRANSDSWIAAGNLEFDVPLPVPISLFASGGVVPGRDEIGATEVNSYWEAGLGIQLIRDVMEVWFPLVVSENIRSQEEFAGRGIAERIRFVLTFESFDPTRALRNVKP